jgi:hypothetical protein
MTRRSRDFELGESGLQSHHRIRFVPQGNALAQMNYYKTRGGAKVFAAGALTIGRSRLAARHEAAGPLETS